MARVSYVLGAAVCVALLVAASAKVDDRRPSGPVMSYEEFHDDFSTGLDLTYNWQMVYKQWGGDDVNGGVTPKNVEVSHNDELGKNTLKLHAFGDLYDGPVRGVNKNMTVRDHGKRVGACVVTKKYFASGVFETRMKVAPKLGVCSAFWTFNYGEYYPGDAMYEEHCSKESGIDCNKDYWASNHEIDMEFPTALSKDGTDYSFNHVRANTFIGENEGEYMPSYNDVGAPQNDGNWHTYRFEWHTGAEDGSIDKRVDFYIDGKLFKTISEDKFIPTIAGRAWLGVWFPNEWAGNPDFDQTYMEVDYIKITPFKETEDDWVPESYKHAGFDDAFAEPTLEPFEDNFDEPCLDPAKWKVVEKNWGGQLGKLMSWNGGVRPELLSMADMFEAEGHKTDYLSLGVHGNDYDGPQMGISKDYTVRKDGRRTGSAVATTRYYASGRYEVRARIVPELGVASAFWTFNYQEYYSPDPRWEQYCPNKPETCFVNHEVDFEIPTSLNHTNPDEGISFSHCRANVWTGLDDDQHDDNFIPTGHQMNDGQWHVYRMDWHTGDAEKNEEKRVEWFIDDNLIHTQTGDNVPTHAGRFWLGAWFPRGWSGRSHFDEQDLKVDWVKITPFNETGDEFLWETYPVDGFGEDSQYPCRKAQPAPPPAGPCTQRFNFHVGLASPTARDVVEDGLPLPDWNPAHHHAVVKNDVNMTSFWLHMSNGDKQMIYRVNIEVDAPTEEDWPVSDTEIAGLLTGLVEETPHPINVTYNCYKKGLVELVIVIPVTDKDGQECPAINFAWHKECCGAYDPDDKDHDPWTGSCAGVPPTAADRVVYTAKPIILP